MAMPRRYLVAQAMGKAELAEAVREDAELLGKFGLRLLSVDGGVRAAIESELKQNRRGEDQINPWNVLTIDNKTWRWLRPILMRKK
jgi:hypothetical protein